MRTLLVAAMLACGAPPAEVPKPDPDAGDSCPALQPEETCCPAVAGLPRCFNGRAWDCEPLPACYDAQPCGIGGFKTGRVVYDGGTCSQ